MNHRATALWLALAYCIFIVYGSLVPLEFRALPLDEAWLRFRHTPFLTLDVDSRADWVANGVLYAPLGFFAARAAFNRGLAQGAAVLVSIAACWALAVGVEFVQLYFPPRTVSLNDITAECIGSVVGAVAAPVLAAWLQRLAQGWNLGGAKLLPRVLELYTGAYLLLCFFPYDLLLSASEVHDKWVSGRWGWWLAPHEHGLFFVGLQWLVELAIALPIGALPLLHGRSSSSPSADDAAHRSATERGSTTHAIASGRTSGPALGLALGLAIGSVIEVGQFFLFSGVSQGASVLSRGFGVALGAALLPWLRARGWRGLRDALQSWTWLIALVYLPLLAAVNGAFGHAWQGSAGAVASWLATHLLPFYYHYYTSEALALFSLGSVALMYAPVVALTWLRGGSRGVVALATVALVLLVEFAKLFMVGTHADPTNALVAVATNLSLWQLLAIAQRPTTTRQVDVDADADADAHADADADADADPRLAGATRAAAGSWRAVWLLAVPLALGASTTFPFHSIALTAGLVVAGLSVWRWPLLALGLIPAALPLLDFAPWSGRFFLDEFDLLQAMCFAVAFSRLPPPPAYSRDPAWRSMTAVWLLLGASLVIATLLGVATAGWPDANSFSSYYSPYNALRIAKGGLCAVLFVMLWKRLAPQGRRRATFFNGGMLTGLLLTVIFVVWERKTFGGLWDFAADFRVTGPFSAMHKGGAYIECFLAAAAAFAATAVLRTKPVVGRAFATLLLAASGYAVMVTYSRNGYAALAVVLAACVLAAAAGWVRRPGERRRGIVGAVVVGLLVAIALPVIGSGYARERLARSAQDLSVRRAHWVDGLALRDHSLMGRLFGTGLGRYPQAHFFLSAEPVHAATYALGRDGDRAYLRLSQGATLYIEQIVERPQFGALAASFEMHGAPGATVPGISLCEKWTLTSLGCAIAGTPKIEAASDGWQRVSVTLDASALLLRQAPWRAPLKLSLATPAKGSVDVRHVRLATAFGDELLANGDFQRGMDRWFFSTDVDPPWHLHSLPVAVLFDQGWFGVLAWSAALAGAVAIGSWLLWRGAAQVPSALPAVLGFLASGMLNTLIDAPRFLWLLLVLAWLSTQRERPGAVGVTPSDAARGADVKRGEQP